MNHALTAGLDIGGTKIDGVCIDADGEVVATVRRPTDSSALLASATAVIEELAAAAGVFGRLGVGVPGKVDTERGAVAHAVNLRIDGTPVPIGSQLADHFGIEVVVENDVNAAAIGASRTLGLDDLAFLSIGTGVAAGFVLDGRLRRGRLGVAGEIGHIPVDPAGPVCPCGQRGCLETLASGPALKGRSVAEAGTALAQAVLMVALLIDPGVIVIGGGVAEIGPPLLDAVVTAIDRRLPRSSFVGALDLSDRVMLAPSTTPVGAIGAALLATVT